ncbi:hypothetical protein QBC46DRAFT_392363 [Diplogelasinospora grovesii]|uniref:Uncharacterized protein n=1 Tax=Diplogelasinospora grovesii TaxID=303347 RepID=A0AAN6S206_9PEZI|nr:hypothetical protein QBC46DRAFT_392363 [Diplogelasinospora grovesii]
MQRHFSRDSISLTSFAMSCLLVTSAARAMISPWISLLYVSTTFWSFSSVRPTMYTFAPFTASACVHIKPMPVPAPVTRATRPDMSNSELRWKSLWLAAATLLVAMFLCCCVFDVDDLRDRWTGEADRVERGAGRQQLCWMLVMACGER